MIYDIKQVANSEHIYTTARHDNCGYQTQIEQAVSSSFIVNRIFRRAVENHQRAKYDSARVTCLIVFYTA